MFVRAALVVFLATLAACEFDEQPSLEFAADELVSSDFIRFDERRGLQLALVTLEAPDRPDLTLVAAVHVADPGYYQDLNRRLEGFDAVFFELVMPGPSKLKREPSAWKLYLQEVKQALARYLPLDTATGRKKASPIIQYLAKLQRFVGHSLALGYQIEHLNHDAENFVHADVTLGDLADRFHRQFAGATTIEVALRNFEGLATAETEGTNLYRFGKFLTELRDGILDLEAEGSAVKLRRFFGNRMAMATDASVKHLPDFYEVVIQFRNERVLEVVTETFAERDLSSVAILYGAGHMPDIYQRLNDAFGYEHTGTEWVTAWNLHPR